MKYSVVSVRRKSLVSCHHIRNGLFLCCTRSPCQSANDHLLSISTPFGSLLQSQHYGLFQASGEFASQQCLRVLEVNTAATVHDLL